MLLLCLAVLLAVLVVISEGKPASTDSGTLPTGSIRPTCDPPQTKTPNPPPDSIRDSPATSPAPHPPPASDPATGTTITPGSTSFADSSLNPPGLPPKLHLQRSRGLHRIIRQHLPKPLPAGPIKRSKPLVKQVSRRTIGNQPRLLPKPSQVNNDRRVNRTDMVAPPPRHRSIGRITQHDRIDLVRIVFLLGVRPRSGCTADRTAAGTTWTRTRYSRVPQR